MKIQNAKKLEKLNNYQIELAKIFIFIRDDLTRVPANIPENREVKYGAKYIDERIFWTEMMKLLDQYKYEEDMLMKMMKIQEKNNDRHTIDYRMIKKTNLENALAKLNEGQNP